MPKYGPADDGQVIDGKVVVFLTIPETPAAKDDGDTLGKAQAAALAAAAEDGIPFCEECERAKRELKGSSA